MQISGCTIVRNATVLDFPLEASLRSLLPVVDELVVNVGASDDDTLARVRAIGDPKVRVLESIWVRGRGTGMLADETARAMAACRYPWGIYIQADEVLADGAAARVRECIERCDADPAVEGVLVDYVHFYGGFDTVAYNRKWYRREVRAVRLDPEFGVHPYRDAQGFRVGPSDRRIRAVASGATMYHYGWARPTWALAAKLIADIEIDPVGKRGHEMRPLLPWIPGIEPFVGNHPSTAVDWISARRTGDHLIAPRRFNAQHIRLYLSGVLERLTGWRPMEFRNYEEVAGHSSPRSSIGIR